MNRHGHETGRYQGTSEVAGAARRTRAGVGPDGGKVRCYQPGPALELDWMCDALDEYATVLPSLTRREEEDHLSEHQYADLPFPESQLVSLAHSLIARGVIDEAALVSRMAAMRARLESCT